jgi:hypothetical protein
VHFFLQLAPPFQDSIAEAYQHHQRRYLWPELPYLANGSTFQSALVASAASELSGVATFFHNAILSCMHPLSEKVQTAGILGILQMSSPTKALHLGCNHMVLIVTTAGASTCGLPHADSCIVEKHDCNIGEEFPPL